MLVEIHLNGHEIVVDQLEVILSIENVIKPLDYRSFNVVDMPDFVVYVWLDHRQTVASFLSLFISRIKFDCDRSLEKVIDQSADGDIEVLRIYIHFFSSFHLFGQRYK